MHDRRERRRVEEHHTPVLRETEVSGIRPVQAVERPELHGDTVRSANPIEDRYQDAILFALRQERRHRALLNPPVS
jgi:hypothetical protein